MSRCPTLSKSSSFPEQILVQWVCIVHPVLCFLHPLRSKPQWYNFLMVFFYQTLTWMHPPYCHYHLKTKLIVSFHKFHSVGRTKSSSHSLSCRSQYSHISPPCSRHRCCGYKALLLLNSQCSCKALGCPHFWFVSSRTLLFLPNKSLMCLQCSFSPNALHSSWRAT